MSNACPHCKPPDVWPHEHVGDPELPLLLIVRNEAAHKEWHFHGTMEQCDAFVKHPHRDRYDDLGQERFEELLLIHKDWDKAVGAL